MSVPNVRDGGQILRHIGISLVVAAAFAVVGYFLGGAIVASDAHPAAAHVSNRQMSGGAFQLWIMSISFGAAMVASMALLKRSAKKQYLASVKNG